MTRSARSIRSSATPTCRLSSRTDNGKAVGRISAQIDHLNADRGRPGLGYFGLIDAIDDADVFAGLFRAAEGWLKERHMTEVLGPMNLNINQEVGLLVDGFDTKPYFMMGHSKPYVGQQVEAAGYRPAKDLLAYEMDPDFKIPSVMTAVEKRLHGRMVIRPIDRKNRDRDLKAMCGIFNDAWENNWGFVPFTDDEFLTIGHEMLLIISDDFIQIAEVDGEPAAFIVMLPNVNEAIADLNGRLLPFGWLKLLWRLKVSYPHSARVPLMGVRQKFQRTRLGPGLAFAVIHAVRNASVARGIDTYRNVVDPREQCRHAQHHRDHRRARFEALSDVRKEPDCDDSVTAEQTFTAVVLAGERRVAVDRPARERRRRRKQSAGADRRRLGHRARPRHHRTLRSNQPPHAGRTHRRDAQRRASARRPHRVRHSGRGSRRPTVRRRAPAPRSMRSAPMDRSC